MAIINGGDGSNTKSEFNEDDQIFSLGRVDLMPSRAGAVMRFEGRRDIGDDDIDFTYDDAFTV